MSEANPTSNFYQFLAEGKSDLEACELLDGVKMIATVSAANVERLRNEVTFRENDAFLVSFPKCGSSWTKQIVKLIANNGVETGITHDEAIPWIDRMTLEDINAVVSNPRFFKSHLPYQLMPGGGDPANTEAKYIYVIRNPKDGAVSQYNHMKWMMPSDMIPPWDVALKTITDPASEGTHYGPFYNHYLGWWTHRDAPNILILTYEEMKRNPRTAVTSIASFLGYNLTDEVIDKIVIDTSFNKMKDNKAVNKDYGKEVLLGEGQFMRKGVIGDWRNVFTPEQSATMDTLVEEKFTGTGLVFDYGDD